MWRKLSLLLVVASSAVLVPRDGSACGGFFAGATEPRPSLAYEQVLLLHDPFAGQEHFVREVAFRAGRTHFGFVVPTPTRPEVTKVETSPFEALRKAFPFTAALTGEGFGAGLGAGLGGIGGGAPVVLEVKKVGSFTAFVLAADDEKGLATWLRNNGLVSTREADTWLAHYVRMHFFYVAMRYDPPPKDDPAADKAPTIKAETIRISFATPLPYYPYFEPAAPPLRGGDGGALPERLLELWMVSPARVLPIAARATGGGVSWVRPMLEGATDENADATRARLETALRGELRGLLPDGPLVVQTFQDQKYSREGFGDVLFAPAEKRSPDPARDARMRPLLGILDPELVPEKAPSP